MSKQDLYLGIDGGGTKTEALVADAAGRILGRAVGGPANPLFSPQAVQNLADVLRTALLGLERQRLTLAAICVPGLAARFPRVALAEQLELPAEILEVAGDDFSTFYGALAKTTGIVVAAGTGSFVTGIDSSGKIVSLGGWGPLLGDEGSGYAIGREALRAVIAAEESNGAATLLKELIFDHYQIQQYLELRNLIYQKASYQQELSGLVPLVLQAAQKSDPVAQSILEKAGSDLAELAIHAARRLQLGEAEKEIAITGGLVHLGNSLWAPFGQKVTAELGNAYRVRPAVFNPAVGALLVAYRARQIAFSEPVLNHLKSSYSLIRGVKGD